MKYCFDQFLSFTKELDSHFINANLMTLSLVAGINESCIENLILANINLSISCAFVT